MWIATVYFSYLFFGNNIANYWMVYLYPPQNGVLEEYTVFSMSVIPSSNSTNI